MTKSVLASIFLVMIMVALGYFIHDSKIQKENLTSLNINVENLKLINKDLDLYLKSTLEYDNFDVIEQSIELFNENIAQILNNEILNDKFHELLKQIKQKSELKIEKIQKVKSYKAILNNSYRIIQKLKKQIDSQHYDDMYIKILTLDKNPEISVAQLQEGIQNLPYSTDTEKSFFNHANIILQYVQKIRDIDQLIYKLNLDSQLNQLHSKYKEYANNAMYRAYISIVILFSLLTLMIVVYLIYAFKLIISNTRLARFRKTVENSDNIVVVTDKDRIIKYVNEAFTRTTGYTAQEAIGQKPSMLKSGLQSKEFYKNLNNTIDSGKKWSGEFINIDKNGELSYEKASITPVLDEKGNIREFIAIKLDITNETLNGQQLKEKERLLVQQSKMASMGEMLGNIAHQWRQPLSSISTIATGILVQKEIGVSNEADEIHGLKEINNSVQYLSETINDFREFFKQNKEKQCFNLGNTYKRTLNILKAKFQSKDIEVIENIEDVQIYALENEIIQVMMNILNNARDVLETKEEQKRYIFVNIFQKENNAIIEIKDNGGGVPDEIIHRIFEPYFTTKHQSQGTGIGLYMSYEMITKHLKGAISVENVNYEYNDIAYTGACFTLTMPKGKPKSKEDK